MLSIAIPTYEMLGKGVEFLEYQFNIFLQQSFKDFEVVVSDHSLNESIKALCKKYKDTLNIIYIKMELAQKLETFDDLVTINRVHIRGFWNWNVHNTNCAICRNNIFEPSINSDVVESWLDGDYENYGFLIRLSQSYEPYHSNSSGANVSPDFHNTTGSTRSYFTKRFFARNTEFWFKKPCIEARWDASRKDDRGNFYTSSSLAPAADNLNTLYLYNYVRGQLKNIPAIGTGEIYVDLYSTLGGTAITQCIDTPVTGGWSDTGIYTASVCLETTESSLYDVWYSGSIEYHTGSISALNLTASVINQNTKYIISLTNHKKEYYKDEIANINVFVRPKNWSPNIYTVAQSTVTNTIIEQMHYKVERSVDNFVVVDYSTGSIKNTQLSYNDDGNYFNFDMDILEPEYEYKIKFAIYEDYRQTYVEQPYEFKFKVSE